MQRYFGREEEGKLSLRESDLFHIKKVMRMKLHDTFEIVAKNKVYRCEIDCFEPFSFQVKDEVEGTKELVHQVTIAQALVKEQKMDLILQKCTELGAVGIIPLIMERSVVKIGQKEDKKLLRWKEICKEASEQSFRTSIPEVYQVMTLKELVLLPFDLKIVCSTKKDLKTLKKLLQTHTSCVRIVVVIGPEGGLSDREEDFLEHHGFERISLGDRILRTESASMFVMSALGYEEMN